MNALIVILALVGELIDSSLGMMYGTMLSPILVLMGYDPKVVVPAVLISQGLSGLAATIRHHSIGNSDFALTTRETKIAWAMIVPGLFATALGAFVASSISGFTISVYIGVLVVIIGGLCISPKKFSFSWARMWGIGLLAGFNKAMSGGGFGPVTTTGKVLGGVDPKISIATTTYAEVPICILGFGLWIAFNGWVHWQLPILLTAGAMVGGLLGPPITKRVKTDRLRRVVGTLAVMAGIILLAKTLT